MLTYFLGGYNDYQIRTKQIPSGSNFLSLCTQNMITQEEYCVLFNTGQYSYNECESFVSFSVDLDIPLSVNIADEYRLTLTPAITSATVPFTYLDPIWNGSLQVFASQSVNKPAYVNQIPYEETFISADTNNTFKYWEQASPSPSTTTRQQQRLVQQAQQVQLQQLLHLQLRLHLQHQQQQPQLQQQAQLQQQLRWRQE